MLSSGRKIKGVAPQLGLIRYFQGFILVLAVLALSCCTFEKRPAPDPAPGPDPAPSCPSCYPDSFIIYVFVEPGYPNLRIDWSTTLDEPNEEMKVQCADQWSEWVGDTSGYSLVGQSIVSPTYLEIEPEICLRQGDRTFTIKVSNDPENDGSYQTIYETPCTLDFTHNPTELWVTGCECTASSGLETYCTTNIGVFDFYYNADHPCGEERACTPLGPITGTLTGASASNTVNNTPGGTYSLDCTGGPQHFIEFSNSNPTIFNSVEGEISLYVYPTAYLAGATQGLFHTRIGGNIFLIWIRPDGRVSANYTALLSPGNSRTIDADTDINANHIVSINKWNEIKVRWTSNGGKLFLWLNNDDITDPKWVEDDETDPLVPFGSEPSSISFGVVLTPNGHDPYLDDVTIKTTYPGDP